MSPIINGLTNWKTTTVSAIGSATNLINNAETLTNGTPGQKAQVIISSIFMFLLGLFAKDADKNESPAK